MVVLLDLTWRYIFSHLFDEKMEPINIFVKRRLFDISERSATFGKALSSSAKCEYALKMHFCLNFSKLHCCTQAYDVDFSLHSCQSKFSKAWKNWKHARIMFNRGNTKTSTVFLKCRPLVYHIATNALAWNLALLRLT